MTLSGERGTPAINRIVQQSHRNLLVHLAEKILRSHLLNHGEDYRRSNPDQIPVEINSHFK